MIIIEVEVEKIIVEKVQADTDQLESLSLRGQRQPVSLRERSDGRYDIIDGRRRIQNSIELEEETIFAIVRAEDEVTDEELHLDALLLNSGKPNYGDEAAHIQYLLDCGYNRNDIAEACGMSVTTVVNRIKLLEDLDRQFFNLLRRGDISSSICTDLMKLDLPDQAELFEVWSDDMPVKEFRELIRERFTQTKIQTNIDALSQLPTSSPVVPPLTIPYPKLEEGKQNDGTYKLEIEYRSKKYTITIEEN